jgi:hypothetical protein
MQPVKRKRVVLTLEEKLEVIQFRDYGRNVKKSTRNPLAITNQVFSLHASFTGYSIDKIAEKYNIGSSTVSEIYKKRVEIENAVEKTKMLGVKRKTLKEGKKGPAFENELYNFYLNRSDQGIQTTKADLLQQAKEMDQINSNQSEGDSWNPTQTWLRGFCDRYGIKIDSNQHIAKEEVIQIERNQDQEAKIALESAEFLLNFMDKGDFLLKDIITVRLVRDKIASELG